MRGKTAFITGGASGIGRAIGEAMARRGANVVLADRQIGVAKQIVEAIEASGGRGLALELDVRDRAAFIDAARTVKERFGSIDYFFNNAGIGINGEVHEYDATVWDEVLDVNLRGVAYGIDAVYPIMVEQGSGHIVNTASMAGLIPGPGMASYTTSKHAVVGLSKALRVEASFHGVRVSVLCPGAIRTPILTLGKYGRNTSRGLPATEMMKLWERLRPMDPDAFAIEVLKDVEKNRPYIILPRWWRAIWLAERLAPGLMLRLSKRTHAEHRRLVEEHGEPAAIEGPERRTRPEA